ncbi:MAG TPA: UPF0149 family protein [Steroidobacteraceae bacterium]|nr:UPF0149 family protein [Steroidobacteraceae bacterium]
MLTVTFDELESALAASAAPVLAAEAHGALAGALAGDGRFDPESWIDDVLAGEGADPGSLHARNLLETLIEETQAALAGPDMEFAPLLPDDEEPLERRVKALADWCTGYLYGIGSGGVISGESALPAAVDEVVRDFGEISRAAIDAEESAESNETSYAEIVEYLRAGAQLAFEELAPRRAGAQLP